MAAEPRMKPVDLSPGQNGSLPGALEPSSHGRSQHAPAAAARNGAGPVQESALRVAPSTGLAGAEADCDWLRVTMDKFESPLVRYAARITGDLERGRDVVQETFLRMCREPAVATSGHLGQWLFTVCRRLAIDVRRKEKRMSTQLETAAMCEAPARVTGQSEMEQSEYMANLVRQLARLPANQQEVVRLKFQEGMSYKQIAEITGLSVSNVGYLLHVAVNALREKLKAVAD